MLTIIYYEVKQLEPELIKYFVMDSKKCEINL